MPAGRRCLDTRPDWLWPEMVKPSGALRMPVTAGDHEALMRHQWVIDVLLDLQSYAASNDLPQLAGRVEEVLALARLEILGTSNPSDAEQEEPEPPALRNCGRAH